MPFATDVCTGSFLPRKTQTFVRDFLPSLKGTTTKCTHKFIKLESWRMLVGNKSWFFTYHLSRIYSKLRQNKLLNLKSSLSQFQGEKHTTFSPYIHEMNFCAFYDLQSMAQSIHNLESTRDVISTSTNTAQCFILLRCFRMLVKDWPYLSTRLRLFRVMLQSWLKPKGKLDNRTQANVQNQGSLQNIYFFAGWFLQNIEVLFILKTILLTQNCLGFKILTCEHNRLSTVDVNIASGPEIKQCELYVA